MSNSLASRDSIEPPPRPIEPDSVDQNTLATSAVPVQDNYHNSQSSVFLNASPLPQYQTTIHQETPPPAYTPQDVNIGTTQMETRNFDYFDDDYPPTYKDSPMRKRSGWNIFNWIFWALVNTLILVLTCILIRDHFVFSPHETIQAGFTIFLLLEVAGRAWCVIVIFSEVDGRMTLIEMLAVLTAGKEGYLLLGLVPLSRKRVKHRVPISDIVFIAFFCYLLYMLANLGVPQNNSFDISLMILTLAIFFVFIRLIVHWCRCGSCAGYSGYHDSSIGWWWCYYSGGGDNCNCDGCGNCDGCDGCADCCNVFAECCGGCS